MKYRELYNLFCEHERNSPKHHLTAYITFAPESFAPDANYTKLAAGLSQPLAVDEG